MGRRRGGEEDFGGRLARVDDNEDAQECGVDGALTTWAGGPDLDVAGLRIAFVSVLVSVVQHLPLAASVAVVDGASGGLPVVVSIQVRSAPSPSADLARPGWACADRWLWYVAVGLA